MVSSIARQRKGIILAGGTGSRLFPITKAVSKQLLPVYDKPMVYYPLSVLMLAGIKEILVITTPRDHDQFKLLLGDGKQYGISIDYKIQVSADGLAQALIIGEEWLAGAPCALILGDNLLFEDRLQEMLQLADKQKQGATVFACQVSDPQRYGIVTFNSDGDVKELIEKPKVPRSNWAVIGLYFYDGRAPTLAKTIKPSARGELEITDLNALYLSTGDLKVQRLGRGCVWMDAGLPESLLGASALVKTIQERTGKLIGSPAEIAFYKNFISAKQLEKLARGLKKTAQGKYLLDLAKDKGK